MKICPEEKMSWNYIWTELAELAACWLVGRGTGEHWGTVPPFECEILTLSLWALHGKIEAKSRLCPQFAGAIVLLVYWLLLNVPYDHWWIQKNCFWMLQGCIP